MFLVAFLDRHAPTIKRGSIDVLIRAYIVKKVASRRPVLPQVLSGLAGHSEQESILSNFNMVLSLSSTDFMNPIHSYLRPPLSFFAGIHLNTQLPEKQVTLGNLTPDYGVIHEAFRRSLHQSMWDYAAPYKGDYQRRTNVNTSPSKPSCLNFSNPLHAWFLPVLYIAYLSGDVRQELKMQLLNKWTSIPKEGHRFNTNIFVSPVVVWTSIFFCTSTHCCVLLACPVWYVVIPRFKGCVVGFSLWIYCDGPSGILMHCEWWLQNCVVSARSSCVWGAYAFFRWAVQVLHELLFCGDAYYAIHCEHLLYLLRRPWFFLSCTSLCVIDCAVNVKINIIRTLFGAFSWDGVGFVLYMLTGLGLLI